jgi:esterase/lipase superfamily enzyme
MRTPPTATAAHKFLLAALLVTLTASAFAASEGELVVDGALLAIGGAAFAVGYPVYYIYTKIKYDSRIYTVWFGTNRAYNGTMGLFGDESSDRVAYGRCEVIIPKGHKFGSVGSSWPVRWFKRITAGRDDKLRMASMHHGPVEIFRTEIMRTTMKKGNESPSALIYIHGFNVDFNEAAIRAAQIGFDLNVPGPMVFFSWPSKGRADPIAYVSDKESIAASETYIAEFLIEISRCLAGIPINILAHSMGNLGLLRALHNASYVAARESGVKFGQIFLAAPDVDVRLFKQLSVVYRDIASRTTLYVSNVDVALEASRRFSSSDRVGYTPPITVVDGIDTIEVSEIDVDIIGHGYFANAAGVLYDISQQIRRDFSPENRPRLEARADREQHRYWAIRA